MSTQQAVMNHHEFPAVARSLKRLGANISKARRSRRLKQCELAEQIKASINTVRRLEQGEPGISLHTLIRALQVLGMLDEFNRLLDSDRDAIGLAVQERYLPKRVRHSKHGDDL